jgi:hypothetical protein
MTRSSWSSASRRRHRIAARKTPARDPATRPIGDIAGTIITRLIGAVPPERNDGWQPGHRYMQVEG